MTKLDIHRKIRKWENNFIRDRWGNLTPCYWNQMCKEEILKLETMRDAAISIETPNITNVLSSDGVSNKVTLDGVIETLSMLQVQLMDVGMSNDDYNDISDVIGNIKERLANII